MGKAELDMLVERVLKTALGESAAEERARRWAEENAEAIRDHRERIERDGVFAKISGPGECVSSTSAKTRQSARAARHDGWKSPRL